ncbi:MAG: DUF1214 domain-containing protein [Acidimicrobiia bacterium]|nr:DUF1214 domain-containing protein [Acidimicrobiia bacterium]MBP8181409.1 DUF1214 domain-containing protein [Acidimicrobiia bacterium]
MGRTRLAPRSREAMLSVRDMIGELSQMVVECAETEQELLEGQRMLGRAMALASELTLDCEPHSPWFMTMNTPSRFVGGGSPDIDYRVATIDGSRAYRIDGVRGSSPYLSFQILAGQGVEPRRMAAYLSDADLAVQADRSFSFLLGPKETKPAETGHQPFIEVPRDVSAVLVRDYLADREVDVVSSLDITAVGPAGSPAAIEDHALAEQFTTMAWMIARLATMFKTVQPELLQMPNQLVAASSSDLGAGESTPDNHYLMAMFRLRPGEALVVEFEAPTDAYWSVSLENIWHECVEPRQRHSSVTYAKARASAEGRVQLVVTDGASEHPNWLDTGGHARGFINVRSLINPISFGANARVVPARTLRVH